MMSLLNDLVGNYEIKAGRYIHRRYLTCCLNRNIFKGKKGKSVSSFYLLLCRRQWPLNSLLAVVLSAVLAAAGIILLKYHIGYTATSLL